MWLRRTCVWFILLLSSNRIQKCTEAHQMKGMYYMDNDAKLRPLYLLDILRKQSDEDHSLSTTDLREILKEN